MALNNTRTNRDMSRTYPDCPARDGQGHPPIGCSDGRALLVNEHRQVCAQKVQPKK